VQPKIYSVDEHRIPLNKIDQHAAHVIHKLREAGHKAYLVGGGVRDLLLGQTPKDFDISTSARPEEVRSIFRNAILIGRRFRLAHVRFGKKIIEVSTFRAGDPQTAELIVRDNEWGTEEQDVLRRDFTINGLFYDPENQTVIDYVDGYPDLEKKMLRTIGAPKIRFSQDPVRMIRLIKFCARFNFSIDPPTMEALLHCKDEIVKSSSARILEELFRMLESGASKPFFHLLDQYGLLRSLMPRFSDAMQHSPGLVTYRFLERVDEEVKKKHPEAIDRSLLLSVLLFPLFEYAVRWQAAQGAIHLGQITEIAHLILDDVFNPFFNLSRRIRGAVAFILSSQFRLVPLDPRPQRRLRVPRDPFFFLALNLLELRAGIEPELLAHCTQWNEAALSLPQDAMPVEEDEAPRRRRRRRRH
jgi:poly(A) polymerase